MSGEIPPSIFLPENPFSYLHGDPELVSASGPRTTGQLQPSDLATETTISVSIVDATTNTVFTLPSAAIPSTLTELSTIKELSIKETPIAAPGAVVPLRNWLTPPAEPTPLPSSYFQPGSQPEHEESDSSEYPMFLLSAVIATLILLLSIAICALCIVRQRKKRRPRTHTFSMVTALSEEAELAKHDKIDENADSWKGHSTEDSETLLPSSKSGSPPLKASPPHKQSYNAGRRYECLSGSDDILSDTPLSRPKSNSPPAFTRVPRAEQRSQTRPFKQPPSLSLPITDPLNSVLLNERAAYQLHSLVNKSQSPESPEWTVSTSPSVYSQHTSADEYKRGHLQNRASRRSNRKSAAWPPTNATGDIPPVPHFPSHLSLVGRNDSVMSTASSDAGGKIKPLGYIEEEIIVVAPCVPPMHSPPPLRIVKKARTEGA